MRRPDTTVSAGIALGVSMGVPGSITTHVPGRSVARSIGCSPTFKPEHPAPEIDPNWQGGFYCPCHGSKFDLAGRVYRGSPAPTNLVVPPYSFSGDTLVVIGADETTSA